TARVWVRDIVRGGGAQGLGDPGYGWGAGRVAGTSAGLGGSCAVARGSAGHGGVSAGGRSGGGGRRRGAGDSGGAAGGRGAVAVGDGGLVWGGGGRAWVDGMWPWRGLVVVLAGGRSPRARLTGLVAATGAVRWARWLPAGVYGTPVATADGGLAVADGAGGLEGVSLADGAIPWARPRGLARPLAPPRRPGLGPAPDRRPPPARFGPR